MKKLLPLILIFSLLCSCKGSVRNSTKLANEATEGFVKGASESLGQVSSAAIIKFLGQPNVSKEQALLQVANDINNSTPMQIDQETVLTNANAQSNVLIYNYVLINYPSSQIDPNKLSNTLYMPIKNSVCSHPDMQSALRDGISFGYSYSGNDNVFVLRFVISPANCGY